MVEFLETGWQRFGFEEGVNTWAHSAHLEGCKAIADPEEGAKWLHCEGTWFVGVDSLPNDQDGRLPDGTPIGGTARDMACDLYGELPLHRGQISVTWPGYPKPRDGESEAAFRYRLNRDAAHVDGLHAVGSERRRKLLERHAYILGLPLTHADTGASPFVVWEGSHHIMRTAFADAFVGVAEDDWAETDLTEIYQMARKEVFDTCRRVEVTAAPGEAFLVHRFALHGIARWRTGAIAPPEGRMIAYFRPEFPPDTTDWLTAP